MVPSPTALQAATILVAMASGKNFWRPKFWLKSGDGDHFTVKGTKRRLFEKVSLERWPGELHAHKVLSIWQKEPVKMTIKQLLIIRFLQTKPTERDGASNYSGTN